MAKTIALSGQRILAPVVVTLAILAWLCAASVPAFAEIVINLHTANSLSYCTPDHIYTAKDEPPSAHGILTTLNPLIVLRTCQDGDDNTHYFLRSPTANNHGICRAFEYEVFPGTDRDRALIALSYGWDGTETTPNFLVPGWTMRAPAPWAALGYNRRDAVYGFVSDDACPAGNDARYMSLVHITDGMLRQFDKVWRRITASPEAFQSAVAKIAVPTGTGSFMLAGTEAAVRKEALKQIFQDHQSLKQLTCANDEWSSADCTAYFGSMAFRFDVGNNGLEITELTRLMQY